MQGRASITESTRRPRRWFSFVGLVCWFLGLVWFVGLVCWFDLMVSRLREGVPVVLPKLMKPVHVPVFFFFGGGVEPKQPQTAPASRY